MMPTGMRNYEMIDISAWWRNSFRLKDEDAAILMKKEIIMSFNTYRRITILF